MVYRLVVRGAQGYAWNKPGCHSAILLVGHGNYRSDVCSCHHAYLMAAYVRKRLDEVSHATPVLFFYYNGQYFAQEHLAIVTPKFVTSKTIPDAPWCWQVSTSVVKAFRTTRAAAMRSHNTIISTQPDFAKGNASHEHGATLACVAHSIAPMDKFHFRNSSTKGPCLLE